MWFLGCCQKKKKKKEKSKISTQRKKGIFFSPKIESNLSRATWRQGLRKEKFRSHIKDTWPYPLRYGQDADLHLYLLTVSDGKTGSGRDSLFSVGHRASQPIKIQECCLL